MLLEVGSVSIRNTKNILFKNTFDVCIAACCFYLWGYAFAYGDDAGGFIGTTEFALSDVEHHGRSPARYRTRRYEPTRRFITRTLRSR